MGEITDEVAQEIAERRARCAGDPGRELMEHLLVAVQRERIAAVGYDVTKLGDRLARAPLSDEARRIIHRAITQIWIDENQHARYVLGVLLRQRDRLVQLGARAEDLEGGVGGWMTAVLQHTTWSEAPVLRLTAAVLAAAARLVNRIPPSVESALVLAPLRDWCAFSADAEESAVLSFGRMLELAGEAHDLTFPESFAGELARMLADERAHERVFSALARQLRPDDGLIGDVETLAKSLAGIDGWSAPSSSNGGGVVAIARGDDKRETFEHALEDAGLLARLDACANGDRAGLAIAIKIDLMLAYHRDDRSSYVDPALVVQLVDWLHDRGFREIVVCDAQNVYGRHYRNRSIEQIARYVGLPDSTRFTLVDLATEQVPHRFTYAMGVSTIGRTWRDAGARISFAKLKTHPTAVGQLTVRNAGTVVPQDGELAFTDRLAEFSTVATAVLHDFPICFGIIDGFENAADGLAGVIADPTPRHPHVVIAGAEPIAVDLVGMWLMGERDPARTLDLKPAIELLGDPRPRLHVVGDATPLAEWDRADAGLLARPLSALAGPVYAALGQRGALFTAPVDADAFPAIGETAVLAAARRAVRMLLGID
jgi:uncharacterized protein (DUF362 family)